MHTQELPCYVGRFCDFDSKPDGPRGTQPLFAYAKPYGSRGTQPLFAYAKLTGINAYGYWCRSQEPPGFFSG